MKIFTGTYVLLALAGLASLPPLVAGTNLRVQAVAKEDLLTSGSVVEEEYPKDQVSFKELDEANLNELIEDRDERMRRARRALKGLKESCKGSAQCKKGLSCDASDKKCYHSPRREGEPCKEIGKNRCHDGLTCVEGICVLLESTGDKQEQGSDQGKDQAKEGKDQAKEDCLVEHSLELCQETKKIESEHKTGKKLMEDLLHLGQLSKTDHVPLDNKQLNLEIVAEKVLKGNQDNDRNKESLLTEIVEGLDSSEAKEEFLKELQEGFSVPPNGTGIDSHAGENEEEDLDDDSHSKPGDRNLGVFKAKLWPNALIRYGVILDGDWMTQWPRVSSAMEKLTSLTGLKFEMAYAGWSLDAGLEKKGVVYYKFSDSACYAHVGYPSGSFHHKMNIYSRCSDGSILHELLHVAGMGHQQTACYRDSYVTVNSGNIKDDKRHNFNKLSCTHGYEFIYDYGSIMHYGERGFSKNGGKTIDCRGHSCGQRSGLSRWDQLEVMYAYFYGKNSINKNLQIGGLKPALNGCISIKNKYDCCLHYDARDSLRDRTDIWNQPCVPSKGEFYTGTTHVCEPKAFVDSNSARKGQDLTCHGLTNLKPATNGCISLRSKHECCDYYDARSYLKGRKDIWQNPCVPARASAYNGWGTSHFCEPKGIVDHSYTGQGISCYKAKYVGCYKDAADRALPANMGYGYSIEGCIEKCRVSGYPFAGLQWHGHCFCGKQKNKYGRAPESECNSPCNNGGGICGGGWRNSVYYM